MRRRRHGGGGRRSGDQSRWCLVSRDHPRKQTEVDANTAGSIETMSVVSETCGTVEVDGIPSLKPSSLDGSDQTGEDLFCHFDEGTIAAVVAAVAGGGDGGGGSAGGDGETRPTTTTTTTVADVRELKAVVGGGGGGGGAWKVGFERQSGEHQTKTKEEVGQIHGPRAASNCVWPRRRPRKEQLYPWLAIPKH